MKNTITFRNFTQKALWDNEISGQISDGFWENTKTSSKIWGAEAEVGEPAVNFQVFDGRTSFNFANEELLGIVGDRMLTIAKASKFTEDMEIIKASEYLDRVKNEDDFNRVKQGYMGQFMTALDWPTAEKILAVPYEMKDMIKDLKDMSKTVKMCKYGKQYT